MSLVKLDLGDRVKCKYLSSNTEMFVVKIVGTHDITVCWLDHKGNPSVGTFDIRALEKLS